MPTPVVVIFPTKARGNSTRCDREFQTFGHGRGGGPVQQQVGHRHDHSAPGRPLRLRLVMRF